MGKKSSSGVRAEQTGSFSYATPALDKGLDILELLAHERNGLTKSEIARGLNRTVSEIFRMLLCLERRHYISQASEDRYVLSLRLFRLVQEHPPTERLLYEALPRMHVLVERIRQSCHLGVLEAGRVVILTQANAFESDGFYVKTGSAVDLTETASGQIILAYMSREERQRVLEEWQQETDRKIPSDLTRHLDRIRKRGFEKRASYKVRGVTNISFPILDAGGRSVAALTVPYIQRIPETFGAEQVQTELGKVAQAISAAIGAN